MDICNVFYHQYILLCFLFKKGLLFSGQIACVYAHVVQSPMLQTTLAVELKLPESLMCGQKQVVQFSINILSLEKLKRKCI